MIEIPGMLMVGARSKSDGKTAFTQTLIERFGADHDIVGVKVTTVDSFNTSHHPEVSGSKAAVSRASSPRFEGGPPPTLVVASSMGPWYITEEKDPHSRTDTGKMLAAGAKRVLWLLALKSHLEQGVESLVETLGPGTVSICESNRARAVIEPDAFVMLKGASCRDWKPSAQEVLQYADRIVLSNGTGFDIDLNDIQLLNGRWTVRIPATAIILAGGESTRMGRDKTMLPVAGQPMIERIYHQLEPHFTQTLISSNNAALHGYLGATVVPDDASGKGPMMGIVSALRASVNDLNFVIACDMPEIDTALMRAMLREGRGYDAVVPRVGPDLYEPLFAVYNKTILPKMQATLDSGNNKIINCFDACRVKYVDLPGRQFKNVNTKAEYRSLIGGKANTGD